MAFPQTELPVFVDIAPGGSPAATPDTWDTLWVDITKDVRVANTIVIEEGIPDEANQADPGTCQMTINNGVSKVASTVGQTGCYSPRNPVGPYYGKLAKNTPLRVRMQRGKDTFGRTVSGGWGTSESGIAWSNPNALLSTDGTRGIMTGITYTEAVNAGAWDFDMTGGVAVNALPGASGTTGALIYFRIGTGGNYYYFWINYLSGGTISVYLYRSIANVQTFVGGITTPSLGTIAANTRYNFRIKAEGSFIGFKIWPNSGSQGAGWMFTSTTAEIPYNMDTYPFGVKMEVDRFDFGTTATTSLYWYDILINSYPFIGTVPDWPARWDKSGNDATAPIKAAGVIRRLIQGKSPVRDPLYSFMDARAPSGLWMLNDDSGSTVAASQTTGVAPATIYSTSPAGWNGIPLGGSASQFTVETDTTISGTLPRMTPSGYWMAWFAFYMPVLPVTNPVIFRVRSSGTVTTWDMKVSDDFGGVLYLVGWDADGNILINKSVAYTPGQWCIGQIEIQQTGGNFTGRIVKYEIGTGSVIGSTSTAVAGDMGRPYGWSIYGSTGFQASAAGPVAFYPNLPNVPIATFLAAARGFAGETAADRIARLCSERNVRLDSVIGGNSSTLGIQTSDSFLGIIGEAARTDLGLVTEFKGGLRYRSRGRRYTQLQRMVLDMSLGHLKEPPEPTDDDQRLRNDVTVSRKNGASARAYDSVSIAESGLYDTSVEINPQTDDQLLGHASFRLYLGTWDELRWPSVTLDLARNAAVAGFIEKAVSLDPGAHVGMINPPANLPVGDIYLLVEHIRQVIGPFEWTMQLTTSPYGPWRIPQPASTSGRNRINLTGSTLGSTEAATSVGATDTWTITNTGRDWDSAAVPYDWNVNGEIVRCTAISGSGTQTATVTRGIGNVVKSHSIGEAITLATPLYVAL